MKLHSSRHVRLALLLSGGAFLGKILGFIREIIFARLLGTTFVADSYRGAVTATLLPIAPFQGDIGPSVLIPLHREWKARGAGSRLFTPLMALFGLLSSVLTALVWIFAGAWVDFIVPGFSPSAHLLTERLVQIMALGMPASVVTSCLSCIEISGGRSRIMTLRATVQNIATIFGVFGIALTGNPLAIGVSYAAGFWILLLGGGYLLWREGEFFFRDIRLDAALEAWREFFRHARPLFVQPFADQINTLVERLTASHLGVGTIAALDYSRTLTETAQFLVSQPVGYVVLAQEATTGDRMLAQIDRIARPLLALAIPISLYTVFFANDIVRVVYERGAFNEHGVILTGGALRGIGCGLWAGMLGYILLRMLNAAKRNGAVARIFVVACLANITVNFAITPLLGTLGLGLGEMTRSVTILTCASISLGCWRQIGRLVLGTFPVVVILGLVFSAARQLQLPPIALLAVTSVPLGLACLFGIRTQLWGMLARRRAQAAAQVG